MQLQVVCIWLMQVTCIYVGNIHFVHFIHSVHSFHFLMKLASHLHLYFASLIFQHGTLYALPHAIFFLFLASFLLQFLQLMVSCPCQSLANPAIKREAGRMTKPHTKHENIRRNNERSCSLHSKKRQDPRNTRQIRDYASRCLGIKPDG